MRVTWYTAMSMDGRIAAVGDDLDFLSTIDAEGEPQDEFEQFIAGVDGVLVGASTLRWLLRGGHGWPHGDLPTFLLSSDEHLVDAIGSTDVPIRRCTGEVAAVLEEMEQAGCTHVWLCGGGDVAGQVLAIDRIDNVVVTIAPVALGAGPALFDAADLPQRRFELVEARAYGAGGSVRIAWTRRRDGGA